MLCEAVRFETIEMEVKDDTFDNVGFTLVHDDGDPRWKRLKDVITKNV